ncbi:MAG: hypothetical protein ACTSYI_09395 [Promethearchaeota archaeon]
MDDRIELVRKFWDFFEAQQYEKALPLLHQDFTAIWKTTHEKFPSGTALIQVNRDYPGSWHTILQRAEICETGAVSIVWIYSDKEEEKGQYYATSFYTFKDRLIHQIIEYYATIEDPPCWRKSYTIPDDSK